ncbi:MAG: phosphatidate cytidylyltransferase [Candidatus Izemoplasma sp.]
MKTRILTGAVLGLVLIPIFVLGDLALEILLGLFVIGSTYELYKMHSSKKQMNNVLLIIQVLISLAIYYYALEYFKGDLILEYVFLVILFDLIIAAILLVFIEEYKAEDFGMFLVSTLYATFGFAALYSLRYLGLEVIGFLFAITVFTDIFAYVFGVNFGKTKLAPKISPKKSVEGSLGGIGAALILTFSYIVIFDVETIGAIELNVFITIILIVFLSIMGQIGDLIASKLKRSYDIKDFSNLFPGHGGIMDRFDSAIFVALVLVLISMAVDLL